MQEDIVDNLNEDLLPPASSKKILTRNAETFVELIPKKRQGKCFGAAKTDVKKVVPKLISNETPTSEPTYNIIPTDTWFHISKHIQPEDVGRFALICRQTAAIVNTKSFWLNIYRKYILDETGKPKVQIEKKNLKEIHIEKCCKQDLRLYCIQLLFHVHKPLKNLLHYQLDELIGCKFINYWMACNGCERQNYMCMQMTKGLKKQAKMKEPPVVVDNWEEHYKEELYKEEEYNNQYNNNNDLTQSNVDLYLLVIPYERFMSPLQALLLENGEIGNMILKKTRKLINKDCSRFNLEMDFQHSITKMITTIRYLDVRNVIIIPWWHPLYDVFS